MGSFDRSVVVRLVLLALVGFALAVVTSSRSADGPVQPQLAIRVASWQGSHPDLKVGPFQWAGNQSDPATRYRIEAKLR